MERAGDGRMERGVGGRAKKMKISESGINR